MFDRDGNGVQKAMAIDRELFRVFWLKEYCVLGKQEFWGIFKFWSTLPQL